MIFIVAGALLAFAVPAASATRIDVRHGDSLVHAVAKARNGDTILIHPGTYRGAITVKKRLKLIGVGASLPVIDASCDANDAIDVLHSGVTVTHLRVQGADEQHGLAFPAEVFFDGVRSGTATDLRTIDTCHADYGVSAFNTGPVKVVGNFGRGFDDSGIYIGGITDTFGGVLQVEDNKAVRNSRGVIVEDSFLPEADIVVRGNILSHNTIAGSEGPSDGLFLHNSDGVLITDNVANGNGASGFHADSGSDHNIFKGNTATGNLLAPFTDDNGDNCGSDFSLPAHCS